MASEQPSKKPRFIKRLDFENCVFSGVKIKSKCKSRPRARYFRDVESFDRNAEEKDLSSSIAIASLGETPPVSQERTSPVLLVRKSNKKKSVECNTANKSSPVFRSKTKFLKTFRSKRKINFGTQHAETATTSTDSPKSPVFKRSKIKVSPRRVSSLSGSSSLVGQKIKSFESEKFEESSYRIEESSQESKQSLHISSVSSSELKIPNTQTCPLDASIDMETSSSSQGNADDENRYNEKSEMCKKDSPPPRKNLKRSGLLARLEAILKKQNSEGFLRQHQGKLCSFENLSFLQYWTADANFVVKCLSSQPESEIKYLFVDRRLVPSIPALKKGSLLQLYPPWFKVNFGEEKVSVLINVVFLKVLDETSNFILDDEISFESIPPEQFKDCEDDLLNDALFSCCTSPFLL